MIFLTAMDFTLPLADPVLKFLIILLIILGAPLLLNKIRIPPLLGLIIAGAVIGPHGFNLVLRDSSIILSARRGCSTSCSWPDWKSIWADFKRTACAPDFRSLYLLRADGRSVSSRDTTCSAFRGSLRYCWPACSLRTR